MEIGGERRIAPEPARLDGVLERQLGGGEQHRQLGTRQPVALGRAAEQNVAGRETLDRAVEPAFALENLDAARVARH